MIEAFYLADGIPITLGLISLAIIVAGTLRNLSSVSGNEGHTVSHGDPVKVLISWFVVLFIILLVGLRPIDPKYTDMAAYADEYLAAVYGFRSFDIKDLGFSAFGQLLLPFESTTVFFVSCAALTVGCYVWASRKMFPDHWVMSIPVLITSFTFYAGSVNILRAGIAGGIMLLALSQKKHGRAILLSVAATAFHLSFGVLVVAVTLVTLIKDSRKWMVVWLGAFFSSFIFGDAAIQWMSHLDLGERSSYFSDRAILTLGGQVRWDFIAYSFIGVMATIYWIFVVSYRDEIYLRLAHVFLATNAAWILINTVPFSDRFAYPSWILIPWIIVAPLFLSDRHQPAIVSVFLLSLFNTIVFWSIM